MKVIVFEPWYDEKHQMVLRAFAEGANAEVRDIRKYEPCDIAVIFGLVKKSYKPTWTKQNVLDRHKGKSLIVVESAFQKRGQYWTVGFGGIHGDANFGKPRGLDRWRKLEIPLKPWKTKTDGPVLVCGQLPHDTNVQDTDHIGWCQKAVAFYENQGIDVRFRPHPRISNVNMYGIGDGLIQRGPLDKALEKASCVVAWNSTTGVDAIIAGVPVIACGENSFSRDLAAHHLGDYPSGLKRMNRNDWLAKLGYAQWNRKELESGECWRHLMTELNS